MAPDDPTARLTTAEMAERGAVGGGRPRALAMSVAKNSSAADTAGVITEIPSLSKESLIGLRLSLIANVLLLP